jgi:MFS family permease
VRGQRIRSQPRYDRCEGQRALGLVRARRGRHGTTPHARRSKVVDEPRLAHAGLTRHERELRPAALGRLPERGQPRTLGLPAYDRVQRGPQLVSPRRWAGRQQRLVQLSCRRRGLHAELAVERRRAQVVHAQSPGAVAARVVQAHQPPVGLLAQRVMPEEPLAIPDRVEELAALGEQAGEPLQRVEEQLPEPLALLGEPVVVVALQQVADVGVDGAAQRLVRRVAILPSDPGERLLERRHVEPERRVPPPLERPRRDVEVPARIRERTPQVVQDVTQVRPRLRLRRVRPEQEGETLSWLRRLPVEQQIDQEGFAELGTGRGAAATLFSLTALLWFALGGVSGAVSDRVGVRRVLLVGAVAMGAGLWGTSRADSLGVALVTYGLGVGVGVACAYVPTVALVGAWFERRRTLALGVAVAGVGVGTLAGPPAAAAMIEAFGWRDSYAVLAVVGVTMLALCALALPAPPRTEQTLDTGLGQALRSPDYRWLYVSGLIGSISVFVPFVHLPAYAEERGVDPVLAAGLIGAIGTASVAGRLALGPVAAAVGLLRTFQGCILLIALSFGLWWAAGASYAALLGFALKLGFGYGGWVALAPAVVADRFGTARLGSLLGVLYTGLGIGSALGLPLAGVIIDGGSYVPAIAGSLAVTLVAFATLLRVSEPGRA